MNSSLWISIVIFICVLITLILFINNNYNSQSVLKNLFSNSTTASTTAPITTPSALTSISAQAGLEAAMVSMPSGSNNAPPLQESPTYKKCPSFFNGLLHPRYYYDCHAYNRRERKKLKHIVDQKNAQIMSQQAAQQAAAKQQHLLQMSLPISERAPILLTDNTPGSTVATWGKTAF
jgi:hypothetical protein